MTYDDAISYIHSISWRGSRPGLSRITELCSLLGNPQEKLPCVHIAGTNGKGSVSAMLTSILSLSGKRVGTFTSPFIYSFNERMSVCGTPISDRELARIIEKIKPFADSMADPPTEFELITAAAFEFFTNQKCDIAVIECGMGGRLDSTNIIEKPLVSIITGVALDHTAFLGNTTEKIAFEKAGIIKRGCPVIIGSTDSGAAKVIRGAADALNAPCIFTDPSQISNIRLSLDGTSFDLCGDTFSLSLCGEYQPRNALIAIEAARLLGCDASTVSRGLYEMKWPARFEIISRNPVIIYDGGHNPQGAAAVVSTVRKIFNGKVNILTGVMADKNFREMIKIMSPICKKAYTVTPDNPRALSAAQYASEFTASGIFAEAFDDFDYAVRQAYSDSADDGTPLIILGSLYMYRQVKDTLLPIIK